MEKKLEILNVEKEMIMIKERIIRIGKNMEKRIEVEVLESRDERKKKEKLRNKEEFKKVLRLKLIEELKDKKIIEGIESREKEDGGIIEERGNDKVEKRKRKKEDKKDVCSIKMKELMMRMIEKKMRRKGRESELNDIKKGMMKKIER